MIFQAFLYNSWRYLIFQNNSAIIIIVINFNNMISYNIHLFTLVWKVLRSLPFFKRSAYFLRRLDGFRISCTSPVPLLVKFSKSLECYQSKFQGLKLLFGRNLELALTITIIILLFSKSRSQSCASHCYKTQQPFETMREMLKTQAAGKSFCINFASILKSLKRHGWGFFIFSMI